MKAMRILLSVLTVTCILLMSGCDNEDNSGSNQEAITKIVLTDDSTSKELTDADSIALFKQLVDEIEKASPVADGFETDFLYSIDADGSYDNVESLQYDKSNQMVLFTRNGTSDQYRFDLDSEAANLLDQLINNFK